MSSNIQSRALEGLTVLDLTRLLPGAVATQYLADRGATVIKIEQPGAGDYGRTLSPEVFARTNAGKKSMTLDLKRTGDRAVLLALVKTADILIEGFRPGVMARLGLDYETLRAFNPRLIYVSLSGYGQHGPMAGAAGHDINYIAMGGLLDLNLPVIPGIQIGDLVGGSMQSVTGILLALLERQTTGSGQFIDVSMTAGVEALLEIPLAAHRSGGRTAAMLTGRYACYNVYQAQDGRWLAVGALEAKFWAVLCWELGCTDLIPLQFDETRQSEVKARVAAMFAMRSAAEWFEKLRTTDACVTPVRTVAEVAQDLPERFTRAPVPQLGEHTTEILAQLKRSGAIP